MEHRHIIIRAEVHKPPTDIRKIKKWIKKLIVSIGMKRLGQPIAVYCNKEGNRGLTCVSCIETSHIAMHSWDETNPSVIQLDVYTCSHLNKEIVFGYLNEFEPINISYALLDRKNLIKVEEDK
jgi:S-adenosylmethionine/arginine decarboxylase-like enzyme